MQMIDSRKKQLKPDAILAVAMKNIGDDTPFRNAYLGYVAEVASKGAKFYQYGNTTFIAHDVGQRRCVFSVRNADTAQNFVKNSIDFIKAIYKDGYDTAIVQYDDPVITQIIRAGVRKVAKDGVGVSIHNTKSGTPKFVAIFKCGPYRKGEK